jgi:hypothetical protein
LCYWDGLASQTNTPVVFDEHNLSAVAIVLLGRSSKPD